MAIVEGPIVSDRWKPNAHALGAGGVITFEGVVRASNEGRDDVIAIYYDCYREMADREIADICAEVKRMFAPVSYVEIVHRIGEVPVGEVSLLVIVASPHRADAFAACQHAIDELKKRAPVWKKERYANDASQWI